MDPTVEPFDLPLEFVRPIPNDPDGRTFSDVIQLGGEYSPGIATVSGAGSPRVWEKRKGFGLSGATVVFQGADLASFEVEIKIWTQTQLTAWRVFYNKFLQETTAAASRVTDPLAAQNLSAATTNAKRTQAQLDALQTKLRSDYAAGLLNNPAAIAAAAAQVDAARVAAAAAADNLDRASSAADPFTKVAQPKALEIRHPVLIPLGIDAVVVEDVSQFVQGDDAESGLWIVTIKFLQWRKPVQGLARPTQKIPSASQPAPTARDTAEREMELLKKQARELENDLARKQAQ